MQHDERFGTGRQPFENPLHAPHIVEVGLVALGAGLQLVERLGTPQHHDGQDGELLAGEGPGLAEHLTVLGHPSVGGEQDPGEVLLPQVVQGAGHHVLVIADHRLPVGGLVAGQGQRVEGEGILLRSRRFLLDQAAEDAHLLGRELVHGP